MDWIRERKRWVLAALILLLLLGLGAGASSLWAGRQHRKVEALAQQLTGAAGRELPAEQRRERWRELRQEMQKLTPAERRQASEGMNADRRRATRAKVSQFLGLPKKDRIAFLDGEINRTEARRQQWERERGAAGRSGTNGPGATGSRPNRTAEERDRMRQQRIDSSSPEDRAMMSEYFKQMNQRRQQRNLPVRGGGA